MNKTPFRFCFLNKLSDRLCTQWWVIALLLLFSFSITACEQDSLPVREFRAVWVATVANIDYPRQRTPDAGQLVKDWLELLDHHERMGVNALVVQIRPAADALYPSRLVPWSHYLTGEQGRPPYPADFDPLAFMIRETHARGMEFHAWFNPFRATPTLDLSGLHPSHMLRQHPNWFLPYGDKYYFNPAIPEVRNHLAAVVMEVLQNYEVDGIHFDDYFYPYKIPGQGFPDTAWYRRYGAGFSNIGDWRRHNIDLLIEQISRLIKREKPHVRFGISPFGVWRNRTDHPGGSPTQAGMTTYDDLYADVLKWLRNDWIDYVAPQVYWHIDHPKVDFIKLVKWWSRNTFGKRLYIGHGLYRVGEHSHPAWQNPEEILNQVKLIRRIKGVDGHIFYNSHSLRDNPLGVTTHIERKLYQYPALLPDWSRPLDKLPPPQPRVLRPLQKSSGVFIRWSVKKKAVEETLPLYYVIYRFPGKRAARKAAAEHILTRFRPEPGKHKHCYVDTTAPPGYFTYQVGALSWKSHREGQLSKPKTIQIKE